MTRALQFAHLALLLMGMAALVCLCWALLQWGDAGRSVTVAAQQVGAIEDKLNGVNGTIAEADKLLLALKSTTVHADMALAHEDRNLDQYDANLEQLTGSLDTLAQFGVRTLDSANSALGDARTDLGTLDGTIAALQPLAAQVTANGKALEITTDSLNARIGDKRIDSILDSFQSVSASGAGILADGRKIADKETAGYLKAHTPWGVVSRRLWGAYDITTWIAAERP